MVRPTAILIAALILQFQKVHAVGVDDQVYADIDYGTFQNPSANVRPRFRYWPNDASVNLSQVADDVREAGRVGVGGIELLGYFLYGDIQLFPGNYDSLQSDWTLNGFGSPSWSNLLNTVLSTAQEEGLVVDMAIGPNQGAGVPAPYESDGLMWDLYPYEVAVPLGGSFDGVLPGWSSGPLVAASTGLVLDVTNSSDASNITLSHSSLADITQLVDQNGHVNVSFPSQQSGIENRVFAYYLKHSHYPEVQASDRVVASVPQSPIENWTQNGSWVVDHFSALGAQVIIDFWKDHLLDNSTTDLIKQVGNYMWEDSQEFYLLENTFWTPNLTAAFLANRGYAVNQYIPLLISTLTSSAPSTLYILDDPEAGASHVADYRQTLTELNRIYLQTLSSWAQDTLGIQFSSQVVYNLPMDMLANIPSVNAPECESLALSDDIDEYRQFTGPANLAGKRVISSELGAQSFAYQQQIPSVVNYIKKSVAGGINQFVIHGYPYSGNYGNTTWPGFTTFDYSYSEMHGRHQPGWDFYSDFLNWTARIQWVTQTGVPKMDIAFWSKSTDYRHLSAKYTPTDLLEAGFSYEYLSPDNFALPEAYVSDGVLAPERQAFKALVIGANEILTGLGVTQLAKYAQAGLPVIFNGGLPSQFEGYNQTGAASANATISNMTSLQNVHVTSSDEGIADTLASLNVTPRTAVTTNGTWYTYWREDNTTSFDYVYVFNDASSLPSGQGFSTGSITFESTGVPYIYDAWTGKVESLLVYEQSETNTTVPLQLAGDQTIIIAFRHLAFGQPLHVISAPPSTLDLNSSSTSLSIHRSYTSETAQCLLSNGTSVTLSPVLTPPFALTNWSLIVESWTSPSNPYNLDPVAERSNLSTFSNIQSLVSWSDISSSLANVSGRGYYSTDFQWPPSSTSVSDDDASVVDGAFIDLGSIVHTARVIINGQTLAPLDISWARADISAYLVQGTNLVEVVVSTSLGNGLRTIWDSIETSGKKASTQFPDPPSVADYGLLFPVQIIPYKTDELR